MGRARDVAECAGRCAARIPVWLAIAALAGTALAQDAAAPPAPPKAAPDPIATEVEAIRRLAGTGGWKAAKTSIDKMFASHSGNPRLLAYLPALESDLRRCLFRMSGPQPPALELLGRGATKYEPNSCRAEFFVGSYAEKDGWRTSGDVKFFDAMFDGEVSVEMSGETALHTTVLLGFDTETRGAYAFVPGADEYGHNRVPTLHRIDPGGGEPVKLGAAGTISTMGSTRMVRYSMSASKLTIETEYPKSWGQDYRKARSFSDTRYRRGFVAVIGPARPAGGGLKIVGKLDPMFARRQIAAAESERFRDWEKANWNRETALPKWILEAEEAARDWGGTVPADCPENARARIAELQRAAFEATLRAMEMKPATGLGAVTSAWQDALFAFVARRASDAEKSARDVIAAAPEFAPAHALAGRAVLLRGDEDASAALFAEAIRLDPGFAPGYDGLALVALRAGDAARMQSALGDGAAKGVATALTGDLRQAAMRLARGPNWKKRFDVYTANFFVSGDTSMGVCNDVAKILEESVDVYSKQFRRRTTKTRARVKVFSGFDTYAEYLADLGVDPSESLGVYLPSLRELCLWLHEDRAELSNTIRHEGFHQFLHDFVDDAPIWFNEGYAEFFGFSRRSHGRAVVGQVGEDQAALAVARLPEFTPLEELLVMEPEAFMAKAGVHYVQSWALVHFLRSAMVPGQKGLLERYADAVLAGRSAKEAYDEVFAPVVARIDAALKAHVSTMKR